jgi:flagellar protein FliO/FliZ
MIGNIALKVFIVILLLSNLSFAATLEKEMPAESLAAAQELGIDVSAPAAVSAVDAAVETAAVKKSKISELKESEIPVPAQVQKAATSGSSFLFRVLGAIGMLGVLVFGGWLMIRRSQGKNSFTKNVPQIKVLGQHYLGPRKSLAIIRVAGESILIGVTETNISMIKSLSLLDEDIPEDMPKTFKQTLGRASVGGSGAVAEDQRTLGSWFNQDFAEANERDEKEEEDFSIKGIRDFVSTKLKNMRNLD